MRVAVPDKLEERRRRAARLVRARKTAGFRGPVTAAREFGWNPNTYKAHEQGRNGFDVSDARIYATAFRVSLPWLMAEDGPMHSEDGAQFEAMLRLLPTAKPEAVDAALTILRLGQYAEPRAPADEPPEKPVSKTR